MKGETPNKKKVMLLPEIWLDWVLTFRWQTVVENLMAADGQRQKHYRTYRVKSKFIFLRLSIDILEVSSFSEMVKGGS